MNWRSLVILLAVFLGVAAASFGIGRVVATSRQGQDAHARHRWLQGTSSQIVRAEEEFERRSSDLAAAVRRERSVLASMVADPCTADRQILAQADSIIAAHAVLMKAVGNHLVSLRESLPEQRKSSLMRLCAESLQGQVQRRYRWRGGAQDDWAGRGPGPRGRGGPPPWSGGSQGGGRGWRYRGGDDATGDFARRLRLTQEQIAWGQQRDPNFAQDCVRLKGRLLEAHTTLQESFSETTIADEEVLARVDGLIEAHNDLERRVARHVMLLRPRLSQQQREWLARQCRGGRVFEGAALRPADTNGACELAMGSLFGFALGQSG